MSVWNSSLAPMMTLPRQETAPLSAGSSPQTTRNSVVLPTPFGPVILRNSPDRTLNDTSLRMCRSPRQALISRASSRAPSGNIDPPRTVDPVRSPGTRPARRLSSGREV